MIVQRTAHPPDLTIQSLRQNDMKCMGAGLPSSAGLSEYSQILDPDSLTHFFQKFFCHRLIYRDCIFLFMVITATQDLIHNIALICHQKQSLRVLIQTSHRIDPLRIIQKFHDIFSPVFV